MDLVRCLKYPHREGKYIVEICPSSFKLWPVSKIKLGWEWKFSDIEDYDWLPLSTTLEVDSHRYIDNINIIIESPPCGIFMLCVLYISFIGALKLVMVTLDLLGTMLIDFSL